MYDMKSTPERIESRLDEAEDQISELKDTVEKNTQSKKMKKDSKRTIDYGNLVQQETIFTS